MATLKRARSDAAANGNGSHDAHKRSKEMDSNQPGLGSKSKPCTKFFSTSGCQFGEGCHFSHYVPGGVNAVSQMMNLGSSGVAPTRNMMPPHMPPNGPPAGAVKTRICNKFNTAEGCKFGDKCHFAHGEWELGKPSFPSHDGHMGPPVGGRMISYPEPRPPTDLAAAAGFGVSANTKISVNASLAGSIIGKGGVNTKQICRVTGVKLAIRDHESDANLKNIELEGTFDQISHASALVGELISNVSASAAMPPQHNRRNPAAGPPGAFANNFKTKICENFTKGSCTFGERCHFAHGAAELRKSAT